MPRMLDLVVTESVEQLQHLMARQKANWATERLHALLLYQSGTAMMELAIAHILQRDVATIRRWFGVYKKQGLQGLLKSRNNRGRKPQIPHQLQQHLRRKLADPKGFADIAEVQKWLCDAHGLHVSYDAVQKLLSKQWKSRAKVARPSHALKEPALGEKLKKNSQDS